ncbi:hypothetical protein [Brevibacterium sediminis]|uniref:hypothetical protein n=1 Tax=Brevibacterium sediminis TaxID=1857024 RepID=UPI003B3AC302
MTARARRPREVFVRRRFFIVFLPLIVLGMLVYMWASLQTLTINGLALAGIGFTGLSAVAAAWDAGDRP